MGFAQGLASALAADGDLDGSFGTGGKVTANFQALDFNDNGSGLLTIALNNATEINGTGDLLTIEFELQSNAPLGASPLTFASAELNDSFGRDFITSIK